MNRPTGGLVAALFVAFALGVGVGAWLGGVHVDATAPIASQEVADAGPDAAGTSAFGKRHVSVDARVSLAHEEDVRVSSGDAVETTASTEDAASAAVVEVMADNSPASSPEISAAHAARQARRAATRAAQEEKRRDFLSTLNLDLLTDAQRKTHEMFLEAQKVRDEVAAEIRRLRAAGEEVPADLQSRLADAQSVLRADHEAEYRILREAAARVAGLDENAVRQLMEDLKSIDGVLAR